MTELPALDGSVAIVTSHNGGIAGAVTALLRAAGARVEGLSLPDIDLCGATAGFPA